MSLVLCSDLPSGDGVLHGTEGYLSPARIYHSEARKARGIPRIEPAKKISVNYGREQIERILNELDKLHKRMQKAAPRYARIRQERVTWDDLVAAVGLPDR